MAKKVMTLIKLQIPAGQATPPPPVGRRVPPPAPVRIARAVLAADVDIALLQPAVVERPTCRPPTRRALRIKLFVEGARARAVGFTEGLEAVGSRREDRVRRRHE